ncbi:MAG: hypothetical protein QM727_11985 [Niabella sp.]
MKIKHFEYIVIYLSVLIVCVLIGVFARLVSIEKGADEYTANIIFWICTGFGILIFAILSLFLDELVGRILKSFFRNTKSDVSKNLNSTENLEKIREKQQAVISNRNQNKIETAIHYTQKEFALYTTNDDLKLLCDYVKMYAEKSDFEKIEPIKVKDLSSLDLYHFGWNIWNHFKPIKQEEVSKLLKMSFFTLKDIELDSIKSHLKDDPKKGIIKIMEDISGF